MKLNQLPQKTYEASGSISLNDEQIFARLIFYGVTLLNRKEIEVWLMPIGHLLDQWEIYKQFNGMAKPKIITTIDKLFG